MDSSLICIIMAVDEGSRMKSDYPTVLHEVAGEPMISHVLEVAKLVEASRTIIVLGGGAELIKPKLPQGIEQVEQKRQLGTGHALMQIRNSIKDSKGEILVVRGNTPLLHGVTLRRLIERHRKKKSAATVLTAVLHDPTGYGRIIRKENDRIARIVEEKEATIYERPIEEVNSRIYCFNSSEVFSCLEKVMSENQSKKYYLTDVVRSMVKDKKKVLAFMTEDRDEIVRVNSREELSVVNKILHHRITQIHMENGITIVDPQTTFIDKKVEIGRDSVIHPFTILEGETVIGKRCQVGPGAHLISTSLGNGVRCRQAVIKEKKVKDGKDIGPYKVF